MAENRILIVEDDESIAELIALNLTLAGYVVEKAASGEEAMELLERSGNGFDLALLDVMLPGIDGFELLPLMRTNNIPVIYLTAKNDVLSKVKGLKEGAEDYIVKPFEALELLARIEKVLTRSGALKETIQIRNVVINLAEHTVCKDGQPVDLKPMEYDVLVMLAKNKNKALSREKIISALWNTNFEGETRTVDVHISHLRKKLGLEAAIKTVSKIGYRLED